MRIWGSSLLLLNLLNCGFSQVSLVQLTETIFVSEDSYFARENSVVFIGSDSVTVVGATWTPETAKELHICISEVTDKSIKDVINTNYHPDRAGGNAYWKSIGCNIHSTQHTYDLQASDWDSMCEWTRRGIKDFPQIERCLSTVVHAGNFTLQQGKIEVLYFGSSHTPDGVFVYFPEEKVLYGGCILKPFLGNLEQADMDEYPITLNRLKNSKLEIESIIAGHGKSVHGPELIDRYLSLLKNSQQ